MTKEQLAEREYPIDHGIPMLIGVDCYAPERAAFINGLEIGQKLAQWCGAEAMLNMGIEEITTIFLTEKYSNEQQ